MKYKKKVLAMVEAGVDPEWINAYVYGLIDKVSKRLYRQLSEMADWR